VSRMGPFLLPSQTPGGLEIAPVTAANPTPDTNPANFGGAFLATPYPFTGKAYIADPARSGPVTGSPLPQFTDSTGALRNHNIFRIEGPAGSALGGVNANGTTIDFIETTDFSLIGRLFTETMPGRVAVKRASYASNASGNRLDVFAKGDPTTQGRLPTQPRPAAVMPELSYFEGSCGAPTVAGDFTAPAASLRAVQMFADSNKYWAQTTPATVPANVCVKDAAARNAAGAIVPAFFQAKVTDKVTISQANYDPAARTLSVLATSSDTVNAPILSLDGFPALTVSGVVAPPDRVRVTSSRGGSVEYDVETGAAVAAPPAAIVAANDAFTIAEDTSASLDLLGNDTGAAGGIVTLVTQPRLGTASVNPDGTVTFTATANASGIDGFSYRVSVGALVSNTASVSISITAVNDATTAVNDGPFTARAGIASVLPNLLDNDIDADGRTDLVDAVELVATAGATVTGGAGGVVTFTAPAPGNYAFTYRALDRAGNLSNTATVIVSVIGEDTVVAASALFRTDKNRWVVSGSDDQPNQTITLTYFDGPAAGTVIGTATGDAAGNWLFDQRGFTGVLNPTTLTPRPSQLQAKSSLGGTSRITITIRN
ncbi:MAG TPA: cadherin-like domain-containing protein, partial [Myxococcales bacterium]|nr:cadherin-like domain-containing protein [Myxococcales bacterium]